MTPVFYVVIFTFIIILFLRIYCRLTVGRYRSQQDMTGKTVLITGASAGIGKATALDLARRNARVLLACRNLKKAEKVKSEIISATGNTNVEIKHLDLESFDSVRKCAEDVLKSEKRLDVLINNAGIPNHGVKVITKDGLERTMQTNHFGHFLLTLLLLDLLKNSKPSRIINVSSLLYLIAVLNLDDLKGDNDNFLLRILGNFYNRSKLANILFTTELARRLSGTGVTVNALHPGLVTTDLLHASEHRMIRILKIWLPFYSKSAEEGAQTSIYLAVDPEVENTTGKFFYDCQEKPLFGKAKDKALARKFLELSEKIVGETCLT